MDIYLAEDLAAGETDFDDNEAIDILEIPLEELVDMIMAGKIEDAKSIVANYDDSRSTEKEKRWIIFVVFQII